MSDLKLHNPLCFAKLEQGCISHIKEHTCWRTHAQEVAHKRSSLMCFVVVHTAYMVFKSEIHA